MGWGEDEAESTSRPPVRARAGLCAVRVAQVARPLGHVLVHLCPGVEVSAALLAARDKAVLGPRAQRRTDERWRRGERLQDDAERQAELLLQLRRVRHRAEARLQCRGARGRRLVQRGRLRLAQPRQRAAVHRDTALRALLHADAHDVRQVSRGAATIAHWRLLRRSRRRRALRIAGWPLLRRRLAVALLGWWLAVALLRRWLAVALLRGWLAVALLWRRLAVALLRIRLLALRRRLAMRWRLAVRGLLPIELAGTQAQQRRARVRLFSGCGGRQGQARHRDGEREPHRASLVES